MTSHLITSKSQNCYNSLQGSLMICSAPRLAASWTCQVCSHSGAFAFPVSTHDLFLTFFSGRPQMSPSYWVLYHSLKIASPALVPCCFPALSTLLHSTYDHPLYLIFYLFIAYLFPTLFISYLPLIQWDLHDSSDISYINCSIIREASST